MAKASERFTVDSPALQLSSARSVQTKSNRFDGVASKSYLLPLPFISVDFPEVSTPLRINLEFSQIP